MKDVPKLQVVFSTNGVTATNSYGCMVTNVQMYMTSRVEHREPSKLHPFTSIAFILIALVVLYWSHKWFWKLGFRAGKYAEMVSQFNRGN